MTFADSVSRMRDSVFTQGGSDATWTASGVGTPCKVILAQPDQVAAFGDQHAAVAIVVLRVRKSEIAAPAADDTVTVGDDTFQIIGTPMLDKHRQVWTCEASAV